MAASEPHGGRGGILGDDLIGVGYLCAGIFIFSFQDVIVKLLSAHYPVVEIVFVRALIALPMIFLMVHYEAGLGMLATRRPGMHAVRSFIMFGAFLFYYLALPVMPLTSVVAIWFTSPLFITALAVPILGERVGWRRWSGILLGFAGAMVIVQPGSETFQLASLLPLLAALCYAVAQLLGRKIGITESASVMSFYSMLTFFYMGGVIGATVAHFQFDTASNPALGALVMPWRMPTGLELAMMVMIGIISGMGFWLLSNAYRVSRAPVVAPFEYTSMLWISILSYFVFDEVPSNTTLIGTAMIVVGGVYVLRREAVVRDRPLAGKGVWRTRA